MSSAPKKLQYCDGMKAEEARRPKDVTYNGVNQVESIHYYKDFAGANRVGKLDL